MSGGGLVYGDDGKEVDSATQAAASAFSFFSSVQLLTLQRRNNVCASVCGTAFAEFCHTRGSGYAFTVYTSLSSLAPITVPLARERGQDHARYACETWLCGMRGSIPSTASQQ